MSSPRPKKIKKNASPEAQQALLRKWRSWMPRISSDVGELMWKRQIFRDLADVSKSSPQMLTPGSFADWVRHNYTVTMAIGVRRCIDSDKRSISLGRLLWEMIEFPRVVSRDANQALYGARLRSLGDRSFDNLVGPGRQFLPASAVRSDLRAIEQAAERIRRVVNKRFAHAATPGSIRRIPTYDDLDTAVDKLDTIVCRYNTLLTAGGSSTTYPVPQFNWMEVLHEPWLPEGHPMRGPS